MNADIIRMVKSGLAEGVVISAIEANDSSFDVSADALIALKQAGISQNIIAAMLAAASRRRTGLAQMQAAGPALSRHTDSSEAPLRAYLIQGEERVPLVLNATARPALVKSSETDLKGIAANQAIGAAIITGSLKAGEAVASATGSLGSLGAISTAGSIVGGRFFRKKPIQTVAFAVTGRAAQAVVYSTQPTFAVVYENIPGVDPDSYEPALVRLIPTSDNYRIFSAIKLKDGKQATSRPLVEQVEAQVQKLGRGHTQITAAHPLEAGEYGLLLLLAANQPPGHNEALFTSSDESISLLVWDFSIAPPENQGSQSSRTAPVPQPPQAPHSSPSVVPGAPEVRREPSVTSATTRAPAGSVAFQTSVGYEAAYDRILNVLKQEGYTLQSASKETGQITTELAIEHGAVDIGRAVIVSLIKESGGLLTIQVTAYKQGRRIGGQWQSKVYTKDKAALLAEKLHAVLSGN